MHTVVNYTWSKETSSYAYLYTDGAVIRREQGKSPFGTEMNQRWVLRSSDGTFIDIDTYISDITHRHGYEYPKL